MKPMSNFVVIKVKREEIKRESGIVLQADNSIDTHVTGVVVSVGDGLVFEGDRIPMTVKENDTVIFYHDKANIVKINNEEHYIVAETDLLAILE
jgi:chaperonin GroES